MGEARFMIRTRGEAAGRPAEVAALEPWFHNLHLPDGTQTAPGHPLGDFPAAKWREIEPHLPGRLDGASALDIGCNAGFYTIELARRGAHVTAIDIDPHFLRQAQWAIAQFGLDDRVELHLAQVYELARWRRKFDWVFFMGVFYHLRYPLLALDILAPMVRERMVFQTLTMPGEQVTAVPEDQDFDERGTMLEPGWPKMAFIEKSLAGDPTNWWAPNHAGVEAILRSAGLAVLARPGHEIYLCAPSAEGRGLDPGELAAATGRTTGSRAFGLGEPTPPSSDHGHAG